MQYPSSAFEIEDKRRRIGIEIEIMLLDAILRSLERINSIDMEIVNHENDPDEMEF